jgi:hypothetical protein
MNSMPYKVRPVDVIEDKCQFCPLGIIRTHDFGQDHLHDWCDGCGYRACLPALGKIRCW